MSSTGLVFRDDGDSLVFVGDFDALYTSDMDPWAQSGDRGPMASYYRESRLRLGRALADHVHNGHPRIEVGCGHGHALAQLNNHVRGGEWHGLDISGRAIDRATKLYPRYRFHQGDIAGQRLPLTRMHAGAFDALILNQCLWYVLERLDAVVANCTKLVMPGGIVIVSQAFLRGRQRYGAEIADGFHGALALFVRRYPQLCLVEAHYDDSDDHCHHDGLLVFRRIA